MRVAVIDLGTNTFNLLIADVRDNTFTVVHAGREVVKLGEKSINENHISEPAYERGINAFAAHARVIKEKGVQVVKAFATSAIREAGNGKQFTARVKEMTGIDIEVIDGEREAELIYLGNRLAIDLGDEPHLIMGIGGGSNEFIIADSKNIYWKKSFKLGVARLLEKFKPEDPITPATEEAVNDYLLEQLKPLTEAIKKYKVRCLVGSSGGFESVVDMVGTVFKKEAVTSAKHSYEIAISDYSSVSHTTIHSTMQEREKMSGLIPMRRDMIVLTYLLIDHVVKNCGIEKIRVSTYALKEGALAEFIVNNC